jgi:2-phospho-L-lactate guanylyltransferase
LFGRTKQRLIPLLSSHERQALARAMLEDVLSALTRAPSLAGVAVITGDADASALAHAAGVRVIADSDNVGTSAAVTIAAKHLEDMGHTDMLVIPADVPLITPADVETLIAAHQVAPSITLVPATADGGTNALACSPLRAVPFAFGEDSLRQHRDAARARGIEPLILTLERIGHDLDRPDDVASFLQHPSPTHTYRCLTGIKAAERLQHAHRNMRDMLRAEHLLH